MRIGRSAEPRLAQSAADTGDNHLIEIDAVSYDYPDGTAALRGVSFAVSAGERIALLGANGCGKSTLLKLLNALVFPTAGEIRAFGRALTDSALLDGAWFRSRVGLVFQNSDAQLFSSSVREELAFGPLHLGLPVEEVERRIDDIARLLGIAGLLDRPPFRLSGGEKRKVAIACTLTLNPDVLLMDEPTSGLDPRSQQWLLETASRLAAAGKTLVTATHDLASVPILADRAVVIAEDHTLAADGPVGTVLADLRLLLSVNLIHTHTHRHGDLIHSHPHFHDAAHEHEHTPQ